MKGDALLGSKGSSAILKGFGKSESEGHARIVPWYQIGINVGDFPPVLLDGGKR